MEQVVIYSSGCPSCAEAEQIVRKLGAEPEIIDVQANPYIRAKITEALGSDISFPQVFVGNFRIGDIERVKAFEASGKLSDLLASKKGPCCRGLPADQCSDTHRGMTKEQGEDAHAHEGKEHVH